ncbi:MAG: hypothetical protein IRZ15_18345 [Bryobacteraceae bacterium]|jgi:Class III cytochrome C family.|nr:hypothetical protein [Bryobacteraceae bacterium]
MNKLILVLAAAVLWFSAAAQTPQPPPAPAQPIPFNHKLHAGNLKLKCSMCHPNRDPGETMGIAPASVCMQCHSAVKTDSPEIQKLAEFAKSNRTIRWNRVYAIPSYVLFSHRAHLAAGNTCVECHGPVAEREALFREVDLSMTGCMNCHRVKNASNDCTYCHEER